MSTTLDERLNQILPRITSAAFLSNQGIGNEIACYIFDYPAQHELKVRDHIEMMMGRFASHHSSLRVLHLNLLDVVLGLLKQRNLLDKALGMQSTKGDAAVLKALTGPLASEKIRDYIELEHKPRDYDLFLMSGVGSAWPLVRAHSLLNSMHKIMGQTPLLLFYPGSFDGTTLRLFGQIASATSRPGTKPYYRAFILIPGGTNE